MKILLIQLRRIGDVLMTTPSVKAVRKHYPDSEIHFLVEPPSDEVLQHNPYIDRLIMFNKGMTLSEKVGLVRNIRKQNYDIVIDFHNNPSSGWFTFLSGADKRVGKYHKLRKLFYTETTHLRKYGYCAYDKLCFVEAADIEAIFSKIDFFISEKERIFADEFLQKMDLSENDNIVTVSPVSRQPYKVWDLNKFAEVCDYLVERIDAKILFIYGPGEEHFVKGVKSHMKKESLPLYNTISLSETRAVFEKAVMHVGNDNGPMHIAISSGIPTIAVFGRPSVEGWTPPDSDINIGVGYDPGCKKNCRYPDCELECIKSIDTEKVKEQVSIILHKKGLI